MEREELRQPDEEFTLLVLSHGGVHKTHHLPLDFLGM
jgi:hypothetical protein